MDDTLRAADRDRDQVAEALREHYAQGRLSMEEFDERSTAAVKATTMGDLRELTADLPNLTEPQEAPRSPRWIAAASITATAAVLAIVMIFGHFKFAAP